MCFACSKEPSHLDGSFEYPQHMFWMRNKENSFTIRTLTLSPVNTNDVFDKIFLEIFQRYKTLSKWLSSSYMGYVTIEFLEVKPVKQCDMKRAYFAPPPQPAHSIRLPSACQQNAI